ncbi:MAG: YmdB family metallophosphoesterase [Opitutales bacterium]|nr:YmdB family metallophosphoesterase [Opitutales bacterium]NRA27238.1 YmdB family metallophosphoesterase [Opitutales bacterium]
MPRILFIGDIVGKPGRTIVRERLPALRSELDIDVVIANAENAASGKGITGALAKELAQAGVDRMTLGDHVWDQRGFDGEIDSLDFICRPWNLPGGVPGRSWVSIGLSGGGTLGIATFLGRQFMKVTAGNLFEQIEAVFDVAGVDYWFIEVHAETTSEKVAAGWLLDGRALAVVGTHTHIPTADGRVLPGGTAYLTDAGMTGPYASVLGREVEPVIGALRDGMPRRFPVARQDVRLCGCLIDFDAATGKATAIERVEVGE